jgi:hypothetical protein
MKGIGFRLTWLVQQRERFDGVLPRWVSVGAKSINQIRGAFESTATVESSGDGFRLNGYLRLNDSFERSGHRNSASLAGLEPITSLKFLHA